MVNKENNYKKFIYRQEKIIYIIHIYSIIFYLYISIISIIDFYCFIIYLNIIINNKFIIK